MTWNREKFPDWPTLLADLRRRPAMWLGEKSVGRLNVMLGSIDFAQDWHAVAPEARLGGFDFAAFETWVEKTYNPRRLSVGSYGLSAILAGSEADGFDLWFGWYDEFLGPRGGPPTAG